MFTEINVDKILRAPALLTALSKNTSGESIKEYSLDESHVTQFHTILDSISSEGIDVTEFRIPKEEVKQRVKSFGLGGTTYSDKNYIRKSLFLTKVDGIINYLEMLLKEKPREAGFHKR